MVKLPRGTVTIIHLHRRKPRDGDTVLVVAKGRMYLADLDLKNPVSVGQTQDGTPVVFNG